MPITNQHRQEDLGQAYVSAVAAKAGFNLSYDKHDYGYDGTVKDVANRGGRFVNTGFGFDYQLKSSANVTFNADCLVYDLESKNYNDLSTEEGLFPKVLILFVLPKDETEWLTVTPNEMVVKRCAWWCSLKGLPKTENEAKKRISIPIAQIFTPSAAIEIMERVKGGHEL